MRSKFAAFAFGGLVALLAVTTVAAVDPFRAGSPSIVDAASVTPAAPAAVDAAAPLAVPVAAPLATQAPAAAAPSATAKPAPAAPRVTKTMPRTSQPSNQHRWTAPATAAPRSTYHQSWSTHSGGGWSGGCGDCCGWH